MSTAVRNDIANMHHLSSFLESQSCRTVHYHANRGMQQDRKVNKYLVENGVKDGNCCYEYGFSCNGQF